MSGIYILLAILMFGVLITIHEMGHFFAARIAKIPVREFAVGFGPSLISWKSKKHDTVFHIRSIPLGGYCAFYAEDSLSEEETNKENSFYKFPPAKRLFSVLMGPVMNIALAFFIAVLIFAFTGVAKEPKNIRIVVESVNESSPAMLAGVKPGDEIISINDIAVGKNFSEVFESELKKSPKNQIEIAVKRKNETTKEFEILKLKVEPIFSKVDNRYLMGVLLSYIADSPVEYEKLGFIGTLRHAFNACVRALSGTLKGLKDLMFKGKGAEDVSGIVGITQIVVKQTKEYKLLGFANIAMLISINLGVMNLLPFPGLDGSRALFLIVELIIGRRLKKEAYVHAAGMIILFLLMIFVTFRDIIKLF